MLQKFFLTSFGFFLQGLTEIDSHGKCSAETLGIDKLRTLLVTSAKESAFRKVVQATMVRDRQHGPVIELNRISVKKTKSAVAATTSAAGNAQGMSAVPSTSTAVASAVVSAVASAAGPGVVGCRPVFAQMVGKMHLLGHESLLLPHRVWKVKFVGKFCICITRR